jgi:carbamoyl-phosphate synthase large subunit
MKGIRVFVSGGAGVIGLELVTRLSARGADVLVGDLKPRPRALDGRVRYRQGDLNMLTRAELAAFAPEMCFHLAATFERSTETYDFWEDNFWHNVRLSHHLMTLAKDLKTLRRVIFASSYLIYEPSLYQFSMPRERAVSLREDFPVFPRNLTGMAKLSHELELRFLEGFRADQFSTVCARVFRGYGRGSRDVISRWIRDLLAGKPIKVYAPEGIFDYLYAADCAEGLLRLAETDRVRGIINLGTGRGRRVQDIVDILREHFPDMQAESVEADIPFEASQADMGAFEAAIGWLPEYDLETAIPEIVSYEQTIAEKPECAYLGNVLVSSSSKKVPLVLATQEAVRRIRPEAKVVAGDIRDDVLTRYVADEFWKMPHASDEQLDALISGCRERGIDVVLPTRDGELLFWSRHRKRLADEGIQVVVAPSEGIRLCLDKLAFAAFGGERGLPFIPAGTSPHDVGPGPYVVKERHGAGARNIRLKLAREAAVEHASQLSDPIYQPFVSGREISIDAWLDADHRLKGLVLRRRERVADGESQVTTTFRDADIERQAAAILEALGLAGPVVMQVLLDEANAMHVIECNARFGGASTTSIAAGLDALHWSLLEAIGADVADYPFDRVPGEVRQVRVPQDLTLYGSDL